MRQHGKFWIFEWERKGGRKTTTDGSTKINIRNREMNLIIEGDPMILQIEEENYTEKEVLDQTKDYENYELRIRLYRLK